jgi:hypothetical protein
MEEGRGNSEQHLSHDLYFETPEYIAIQALVDAIYRDSDGEAFKKLNDILEETHGETEAL